MPNDKLLKQFITKILGLESSFATHRNGNGLFRALVPAQAIFSNLKRDALSMRYIYNAHATHEQLQAHAEKIEGSLLTLATVGVLTDQQAQAIIDELRAISL